MADTLYTTLGIPTDANLPAIKSAYRKKASVHHPDKGGDEEDFKRVKFAYEVLSDESRRKQYDDTGRTEVDNEEVRLWQELMQLVSSIIYSATDVGSLDIIETARTRLKTVIAQNEVAIQGTEKTIQKYQKAADRLSCTEGENLMAEGIHVLVSQGHTNIKELEYQIKGVRTQLIMLSVYSYSVDPKKEKR